MTPDLSPNGTAPWYAKLGLYVLTNVAPTMIILGIVLALVTGWLPFPVLTAVLGVRSDLAAIEDRLTLVERNTAELAAIFKMTLATQRGICFNTARTDQERQKCYQ